MKRSTVKDIIAYSFFARRRDAGDGLVMHGNAESDQLLAESVIRFFENLKEIGASVGDRKTYEDYKMYQGLCMEIHG